MTSHPNYGFLSFSQVASGPNSSSRSFGPRVLEPALPASADSFATHRPTATAATAATTTTATLDGPQPGGHVPPTDPDPAAADLARTAGREPTGATSVQRSRRRHRPPQPAPSGQTLPERHVPPEPAVAARRAKPEPEQAIRK